MLIGPGTDTSCLRSRRSVRRDRSASTIASSSREASEDGAATRSGSMRRSAARDTPGREQCCRGILRAPGELDGDEAADRVQKPESRLPAMGYWCICRGARPVMRPSKRLRNRVWRAASRRAPSRRREPAAVDEAARERVRLREAQHRIANTRLTCWFGVSKLALRVECAMFSSVGLLALARVSVEQPIGASPRMTYAASTRDRRHPAHRGAAPNGEAATVRHRRRRRSRRRAKCSIRIMNRRCTTRAPRSRRRPHIARTRAITRAGSPPRFMGIGVEVQLEIDAPHTLSGLPAISA